MSLFTDILMAVFLLLSFGFAYYLILVEAPKIKETEQ